MHPANHMSADGIHSVWIARVTRFRQMPKRGFKFEGQQHAVRRFAPEGRDVYSLAVFLFTPKLRRSAIALARPWAIVPLPGFAPPEREFCVWAGCYKHLAPPGRKQCHCCSSNLNPPNPNPTPKAVLLDSGSIQIRRCHLAGSRAVLRTATITIVSPSTEK